MESLYTSSCLNKRTCNVLTELRKVAPSMCSGWCYASRTVKSLT